MKKLVAVLAVLFVASAAFAAGNQAYFGVNAGYTKTKIKVDNFGEGEDSGALFGLNGGWENDKFRAELDFQIRQDMVDNIIFIVPWKNTLEFYSFMANGYYKFYNDDKFSLYAGAGIGVAKTKAITQFFLTKQSTTDSHTILGLYAGATYNISEALKADLGVDFYYWKFEKNNVYNIAPKIGLRYAFYSF